MARKTAVIEDDDDFADLDFDDEPEGNEDLDEFADLDFDEPEEDFLYTPVDLNDVEPEPDPEPTKSKRKTVARNADGSPKLKPGEYLLIMSGHCRFPQTERPEESHARCQKMGGGSHGNPRKDFYPCSCLCHFPGEQYECSGCGGTIVAAEFLGLDEDGDPQYVHLGVDRLNGKQVMSHVLCGNG